MPTPRQVTWAKVRIVAVAIAAFTILGVIFYLLTGGTLLQEKTTLYLYIPDATGVAPGTPVRVDGIDVGKVHTVALSGLTDPQRIVRVSMTIERQWLPSIPSDSWAELSTETLIGDKYVDVSSGASRTSIQPNATMIYRDSPDIMKRLDLAQFRKQITAVDAILTQIEQGQGPLGQFVQGTGMYEEWRKLLRESHVAMNAMISRTGTLGSQVYSEASYQHYHQVLVDFDQSLARLQSGQGQFGPLLRDDAQYQQLIGALGDLRKSLAAISGGQAFQSDADYVAWEGQLRSLMRAIDLFNASPPMISSDVYDTLTGMTRELQSGLKDFRIDPKKYLRMKVF